MTLAPSADYDSEVTLAAVAVLAGLVVLLLTSEADELVAPLVPTWIILARTLIFATLAENQTEPDVECVQHRSIESC